MPGPGVVAYGFRDADQWPARCSCAVMLRGAENVAPPSVDTIEYVSRDFGLDIPLHVLYGAGWRLNSTRMRPERRSRTGDTLKMDAFADDSAPKSVSTLTTIRGASQVAPPSRDVRSAMSCRPHTLRPPSVGSGTQSKSLHDGHRASAKAHTVALSVITAGFM